MTKKNYKILSEYPYDNKIFTQGLYFDGNNVFVSSGEYGKSFISKVNLINGSAFDILKLEDSLFAEGITIHENKLVLLTWKEKVAFEFEKDNYMDGNIERQFTYDGEAWGITNSSEFYYVSDGTDTIQVRNINKFSEEKKISITYLDEPLYLLNELEYANGYLYANVWYSELIYKIDSESGEVVSTYDLSALINKLKLQYSEDEVGVLNGIAHISDNIFFITGKNWPAIFKIRLE